MLKNHPHLPPPPLHLAILHSLLLRIKIPIIIQMLTVPLIMTKSSSYLPSIKRSRMINCAYPIGQQGKNNIPATYKMLVNNQKITIPAGCKVVFLPTKNETGSGEIMKAGKQPTMKISSIRKDISTLDKPSTMDPQIQTDSILFEQVLSQFPNDVNKGIIVNLIQTLAAPPSSSLLGVFNPVATQQKITCSNQSNQWKVYK